LAGPAAVASLLCRRLPPSGGEVLAVCVAPVGVQRKIVTRGSMRPVRNQGELELLELANMLFTSALSAI